jgi:hypothetical protein
MNKMLHIQAMALAAVVLLVAGCVRKQAESIAQPLSPVLESELKAFFVVKEAQARELQERDRKEFAKEGAISAFAKGGFPPEVWKFFAAGKKGDWSEMSALFTKRIAPRSYQFEHPGEPDERYSTTAWQPVNEAHFAYQQLAVANPKHLLTFGRHISGSLPTNSIYFAGTDAGRFVVDFASLASGRPRSFTLISQNQLADGMYLDYLRANCATELQLLTNEDSSKFFADYLADAKRRLETNQLKPGEHVELTNGRVQVSGMVPVMEINARLARALFEKNPTNEFFIDNQLAFDWAYPHVEPYGFILKINHEPLSELSEEVVKRDYEFWKHKAAQTIGDWLSESTSVREICDWVERVYLQKDLNGFKGDVDFVGTAKISGSFSDIYGASAVFSKSRANIADVYAWRAANAKTEHEKQRMSRAADFAFRQAVALGLAQLDAARGYYNFLLLSTRHDDALKLVQTVGKFRPGDKAYQEFVAEVEVSIQQKDR